MNHAFPANLPLLRRIYAGRFSHLLFFLPFVRLDDPDVVTVYRGSYTHAAFITDAMPRLSQIDCDYFVFVHDDVLLNPQLDERNFLASFPLGPDDGFIPWTHQAPAGIDHWAWYYSLLPKLFHPKSLLFGSGIEYPNLIANLPDAETIRAGFRRSGTPFAETVQIETIAQADTTPGMHTASGSSSAVVLDGLSARLDHATPLQQSIDRASRDALETLTEALALAAQRDARGSEGGGTTFTLPIPLAASAFFTDCYILPQSRLEAFAHYMGVAGAAGLFVEFIAPVLLHAVCERVWKASDFALDFGGFAELRRLVDFLDPAVMATHPVKFSMFKTAEQQDALAEIMACIRHGNRLRPDMAVAAGLDATHTDPMPREGWHQMEAWGRWASGRRASLHIAQPAASPGVRLRLIAPIAAGDPPFTGTVLIPGHSPQPFSIAQPNTAHVVDVRTSGVPLDIVITSERLFRPRDVDPTTADDRALGIGLLPIEAL